MDRVNDYLEKRKKRMDGSAKTYRESDQAKTKEWGNNDAVRSYLSKRDEERGNSTLKNHLSDYVTSRDFNKDKKDYGIGFTPSEETLSLAREFANRKTQQELPVGEAYVNATENIKESPYTQEEFKKMVADYQAKNGDRKQTIYKDLPREEYIEKGKGVKNPEIGKNPFENIKMLYGTPFGNPIKNKVEYAFNEMEKGAKEENAERKEGEKDPNYVKNVKPYVHMTEAERDEYNYWYGKLGEAEADKYLDSLRETLNAREAEEIYQDIDNRKVLRKTNKALAVLGAQGKEGIMDMTKGVSSMLRGKGPEDNKASVEDYLSSRIMEDAKGPEKLLYQVSGAVGNMIPSVEIGLLNPLAGSTAFGLSAAGGAYEDAVREGQEIGKAQDYAVFNGLTEAITQTMLGGISGLGGKYLPKALTNSKTAKAAEKGMERLVSNPTARKVIAKSANYAGEMASEGLEEYVQELMDKSARNLLFDEKNEISLADPDAWYAALLGTLTAGAMNAPGAIAESLGSREAVDSHPEQEIKDLKTESADGGGLQTKTPESMSESAPTLPEPLLSNESREIPTKTEKARETADNGWERTKTLFSSLGENGQRAAADYYDGTIEMPEYQEAFNRYYTSGRYGSDMGAAEKRAIAAVLTTDQAMAAYKAGAQDRNLALKQTRNYKMGPEKVGRLINNAKAAVRGQTEFLQEVGKKTGLTFVLEDSLKSGAVGEYEGKAGTIRISTDSKNFLQTNSHELTHFLKDYNPEGYEMYKTVAVTSLLEAKGVTMEKLVGNYETAYEKQGQKLTHDEIMDEIVADATGGFLNDEAFVKKVIAKDKTVGQKIVDFLTDMIESVKGLISHSNVRAAAKGLEENVKNLELAREIWLEELDKAGESYRGGRELADAQSVKFTVKELDDGTKYVEADVNQEQFDNLNTNEKLKLAEKIVMENFRNKVIGEKPDNAYVDRNSGKEYRNPARYLPDNLADAKARVSPELDKLMETAEFTEHFSDDGRHSDMTGGWDHYKVRFKVGGEMYEGQISVGITDHGRVFKDMTKIKNISHGNSGTASISLGSSDSNGDVPYPTDSGNAGLKPADRPADPANGVYKESIADKNGNSNSKDIKYQIEDVDSDGNELSEVQNKYFNESKVRDDKGRLMVMYHGSPNADFTEFRPGTYFTENKGYADLYQDISASMLTRKKSADHPDTYKVYLNIKKPFDTRLKEAKKIWDERFYRQYGTGTPLMESGLPDWSEGMDLQEFIEEKGLDFDGIIVDEGGYEGHDGTVKKRGLAYIVMSPEQVKNVNNLEPTAHKDIRYQLEDVDHDVYTTDLAQENQNLREAVGYLEHQLTLTKKYQPRMDDIKKIAGNILNEYHSTYKKETLVNNLSRLYEYIRSSEQVDGREVTEAATAIARSVLNRSQQADTEMVDKYKTVLSDLKTTQIRVPESQRKDLDIVGGYHEFRRKNFGRLSLGNQGVDVDTVYQELSGKYPELFPEEIMNPVDQLMQMGSVVNSIRPQIANPYQADIEEMAYMVGQQIFDNYFDVRNLPPTKADRMAAEADRVRREYSRRMEQFRANLKGRYQESLKEARRTRNEELQELKAKYEKANAKQKTEYKKKMDELREYKNLKIRTEQELYQRRLTERRERTEAAQTRKSIIKDVTELQRWLLTPTDKKHVPEGLRKMLAEFLGGIDYSSERLNQKGEETARTKAWNSVKDLYAKIANSGGVMQTDEGTAYIDVDPDIVERMEGLSDKVKDIEKLDNLSLRDLTDLQKTVQAMKHSIQDANKLRANHNYESLSALAMKSLGELSERKDKIERIKTRGAIDSLMRSDMLDAYTMFNRFGPAAESVYTGLRDGLDKKIRNTKTAQDYMRNLMQESGVEGKEIRDWQKADSREFEVGGGKISLTPAQVMSLYVLNKRKQARGHIYNKAGGIKAGSAIGDETIKIAGKEIKIGGRIVKSNKPVWLTEGDVNRITGTLTSNQKKLADGTVEFFTNQTAEWGNEVSLELYGYKKFNAPNYFPIKVDKNQIATTNKNIEQAYSTLKNMGFTKATTNEANNPLIIEDIFDVYTRQADAMGSYNAFVKPLSDLQKYFNFNHMDIGNIKQELERTFGSDSEKYITDLMRDINGVGTGKKDLADQLMRNVKTAAVGFNIRTAIQQPTAYFRALAEINLKYLSKGLKIHVPDSEWELCKKYAPIAQWKDWGYFDINTGRSMKSILTGPESVREMAIDASMDLAGKGDELAWKRLWEATKAETDDLHPELKSGTEAYYQQCGKRFSEIIDRTQVVDTVLHRSAIMKRDGIAKYYTAFMSEPIKSYNMLYRAYADALLSKEKTGKMDRKLMKSAGIATAAFAVSGIMTSVAASIVDALRDDDDKKKISQKYLQALGNNLWDNLGPWNMIPVVRDAVSIYQGYPVNRMDMQAIQYSYYAVAELEKYLAGESKYTLAGVLYKWAKPVSMATGISASNLLRDTGAIFNTVVGAFGENDVDYMSTRAMYQNSSTNNTAMYVQKAVNAYLGGSKKLGDKIIRDLVNSGIDTDKIDDKIKNILKKDPSISEAAEAKSNGEFETYENIVQAWEGAGFETEDIVSAIRSKEKKIKGQKEETEQDSNSAKQKEGTGGDKSVSLYENADMYHALNVGNGEAFSKIAGTIYQEKKRNGIKPVKARSDVKKTLTTKYKQEFIQSDGEGRTKIKNALKKLNLDGVQIYKDEDFKQWSVDAQKAKKKK